jgi:hypothetical protein
LEEKTVRLSNKENEAEVLTQDLTILFGTDPDPRICTTDLPTPDPDPALFVSGLQDAKKDSFSKLSAYYF